MVSAADEKTRCQRRHHQRIDFKWTERNERIRDESSRGEHTKEMECGSQVKSFPQRKSNCLSQRPAERAWKIVDDSSVEGKTVPAGVHNL